MKTIFFRIIFVIILLFLNFYLKGQTKLDTASSKYTLPECIKYSLANQPLLRQSQLDEDIIKRDIRIALSDWYPQVQLNANLQHYFIIPTTSYPNLYDPTAPAVTFPAAANYMSSVIFSANQTLYSNSLFLASRTSRELNAQASQNTENTKINTIVGVTKAFFDVLLTEEQIKILNEDILRLQRNYKDAFNLYKNGVTDKTDYQRTNISLSNAQAQRKTTEESVKVKYEALKQLMGVAPEKKIKIVYDSAKSESDILIDTTKLMDYSNRIEFQLLQTTMKLQRLEIGYYRWGFLPTLSAFFNYVPSYGNNQFSDLYTKSNTGSFLGLELSLPLFQGTNRLQNLSKAKLQYQRLQFGMDYLKSEINTEYIQALSSYKSNLNELRVAKSNTILAKEIFNTVKLQYDKGIKAYLEVIVSETDLRSAELNYLDVLFRVLTSKTDLEKARGEIK